MKKEQLSDVIGNLNDDLLQEANEKPAKKARRRYPIWIGSVAAVVALALLITGVFGKTTPPASALCLASPEYPAKANENIWESFQNPNVNGNAVANFYAESIGIILGNAKGENVAYSPLNLYFALSMLAECAEGESRQQILDVLGMDSMEALRSTAKVFWEASYKNDEYGRSTLANSVWLSDTMSYNEDAVKTLAENYYASSYTGTMGSDELNKALQEWLDKETGGLLKEQAKNIETNAQTLMMLASTLYFQSRWCYEFNPQDNTEGTFHGTKGDENVTFLNKSTEDCYYYGDNFGAVSLALSDGSNVWLILPDEGTSAEELAKQGIPVKIATPMETDDGIQTSYCHLNISMPKTDISSSMNLVENLKEMGISDVFDAETANLSGILSENCGAWVDLVEQDARLVMDEEGVTAAAFTVMGLAGAGMTEDKIVNFTLDRPFIVVVTNQYSLPVMTAIVNSVA